MTLMIATIIFGLLSVQLAYIAKYRNAQWGLKLSFALIFLFLALRYDFGNDYQNYLQAFQVISQYDWSELLDHPYHFEMGWVYLNWLFRTPGFFVMTAILAFLSCAVYYRFIKKYVSPRYYWLAVFIYVFYPDFMLIQASAMRQSVAVMLFIFSLDYLYKKNAVRYFLCVALASLFHFSALILIPVYFLGVFNWRINRAGGLAIVFIYAALAFFSALIAPYVLQFIGAYFTRYANYQDPGIVATGLGFVFVALMLILALSFEREQNRENALVFKIAIISFLTMPFNLIIQLIGRLSMYFAPAIIVMYPMICVSMKKQINRLIFLSLLFVFTIYKFISFFHSETYSEYYAIYQTIFSAPQWY